MLIRCAIVDDDSVFTNVLEHYISQAGFFELAGKYPDAESASRSMDLSKIDLLFLDIEMPGKNGIDFLKGLPVKPPVIIVSRKKEYGVEAFDCDAIDYLYKPVSYHRFLKAANKARSFFEKEGKHGKSNKESLFIRQNKMWVRIPVNEILFIKGDDNDVIVKSPDRSYTTHAKLSVIYSLLPEADFMQVHRSYLVNLNKIEKVDGQIIEINTRTIPVSKAHIKELHHRLNIS